MEVWNIYPSCFPVSLRKGHSVQLNLDAKTLGKRPKKDLHAFLQFWKEKEESDILVVQFFSVFPDFYNFKLFSKFGYVPTLFTTFFFIS